MLLEVALSQWLVRLVVSFGSGIILSSDERLFIGIFRAFWVLVSLAVERYYI